MKENRTILTWIGVFVAGFLVGVVFSSWKLDTTIQSAQKPHGHPRAQNTRETSLKEQLAAVEEMAKKSPKDPGAWTQLGNAYFGMERYQDAINAYEKALEIVPNDVSVITDTGVSLRRMGKGEQAAEYFRKALEIEPDHELAMFNLGIVLRDDLKDTDAAIEIWKKFLEKNPDSRLVIMVRRWLEQAQAEQTSKGAKKETGQ